MNSFKRGNVDKYPRSRAVIVFGKSSVVSFVIVFVFVVVFVDGSPTETLVGPNVGSAETLVGPNADAAAPSEPSSVVVVAVVLAVTEHPMVGTMVRVVAGDSVPIIGMVVSVPVGVTRNCTCRSSWLLHSVAPLSSAAITSSYWSQHQLG